MSNTSQRILIEASELASLPARVPLLPIPGAYTHPSYGEMDITAERLTRFVQNHNARIYQQRIPIDAEHETKLSGALGYIGDAQVEADGSVSASVEWTPRGEALVASGGFRYVSPEWYEQWTDPGTGQSFDDVLIGLAITTRPFFKESALPPLVAREQPTSVSVPQKEQPVSEPQALTEAQVNEIVSTKLIEQAQTFQEELKGVRDRLTATEQENVTLKNANRLKGFREEVMGRSDANGTRWFGDIETHITVLDALGDDDRQKYIEQQRALAKQVTESGAFREIGSGHGDTNTSALAEIESKARAYSAEKGVTYSQAFAHIIDTDSELRGRYAKER